MANNIDEYLGPGDPQIYAFAEWLDHLDEFVCQPETCSTIFSSSHIAKIANLHGQFSNHNSKPEIQHCFVQSAPQIIKTIQDWSRIPHMSFVRIEIRRPMPGASRIEMSTQTCATPV